MPSHPEMPDDHPLAGLMAGLSSLDEVVDVWCVGCGDWRKMNAVYAKHLQGEIQSCGICRQA